MKRSKVVSLALVGTLAVSAMLAGTYAWQSIHQQAKNQVKSALNPGARLHDDFSGIRDGQALNTNNVKNVYVENFTSENDGATVYARIRLDEYLEIGEGAGDTNAANNKAVSVDTAATLANVNTWTTYKWDNAQTFRQYVQLNTGGSTVYLPTYNMNKDSLEADINGTLEGPDRKVDDSVQDAYKDFKTYTAGTTQEYGVEIYDIDTEDPAVDELSVAGLKVEDVIDALVYTDATDAANNGANVGDKKIALITTNTQISVQKYDATGNATTVNFNVTAVESDSSGNVEAFYVDVDPSNSDGADLKIVYVDSNTVHTARTTANATVITMQDWKTSYNCAPGNYWVCDTTDGWAYWANPIDPYDVTNATGGSTGCLINSIELVPGANLSGEYYYGLNVVAEFATAGDWGTGTLTTSTAAGSGTGFYKNSMTSDGLQLLEIVSGQPTTVNITGPASISTQGLTGETGNNTAQFRAVVNQGSAATGNTVTWSIEGSQSATNATSIDSSGLLTVGADEQANTITVVATTTSNARVAGQAVTIGKFNVPIKDWYEVAVTLDDGSTSKAYAACGSVLDFKAVVKKRGVQDDSVGVTWSVTDGSGNALTSATAITTAGQLTIVDDEIATALKVTAECADNTTYTGSFEVNSVLSKFEYIRDYMTDGMTEKIRIDGIDWYVMAKENSKALLWAVDNIKVNNVVLQKRFDDNKNAWETSEMQIYLNGDFKDTLTTLSPMLVQTTLKTRSQFDASDYVESTDYVFCLSEADLFGKVNTDLSDSEMEATDDDYTVASKGQLITTANEACKNSSTGWYWLRSPRGNTSTVARCNNSGAVSYASYNDTLGGVRPALWIDLTNI